MFQTLFISFLFSFSALAADCGWSKLSAEDQATLVSGEIIQRTDYSKGISDYRLDNWGLSGKAKLFNAVAAYYDYSTYSDGGSKLVDRVSLIEGEVASNNPALYRVTPLEGNPFGDLYQPFNLSLAVRPNRETYIVNIDYLSSPNIVNIAHFEMCFAQVDDRVLVNLKSRFVGNPDLGLDTPGFGIKERNAIWELIFKGTMKKVSYSKDEQVETLKKALLGKVD